MGVDINNDGDTISVKPAFTREANEECEKRIHSNAYVLNVEGKLMRQMTKDFTLCAFNLTNVFDGKSDFLKDINKVKPEYVV